MTNSRKILIIGNASGFSTRGESRIDCCQWTRLTRTLNLSDYDTLLIDFTSLPEDSENTLSVLCELMSIRTTMDILIGGGYVIVIGDPRPRSFKGIDDGTKTIIHDPVYWCGIDFVWDDQCGDTTELRCDQNRSKRLVGYLSKLKSWGYSLRHWSVQTEVQDKVSAKIVPLAVSRYDNQLAFSVLYSFRDHPDWFTIAGFPTHRETIGPILFVPEVPLPHDEMMHLVLLDICEVPVCLLEPEWLEKVSVSGQGAVDKQIDEVQSNIENQRQELGELVRERARIREKLRLLYDVSTSLEKIVHQALFELGAEVIEPEDKTKEDGLIIVSIDGVLHHGVLEIKGQKAEQFTEDGLKQLPQWISRIASMKEVKPKGIFIGNAAVEIDSKDRPDPYSESFKKHAELMGYATINTTDIYRAYESFLANKLDKDEFWRRIFSTDGVVDFSGLLIEE